MLWNRKKSIIWLYRLCIIQPGYLYAITKQSTFFLFSSWKCYFFLSVVFKGWIYMLLKKFIVSVIFRVVYQIWTVELKQTYNNRIYGTKGWLMLFKEDLEGLFSIESTFITGVSQTMKNAFLQELKMSLDRHIINWLNFYIIASQIVNNFIYDCFDYCILY